MIQPYDVDPLLRPYGAAFQQRNVVTFYGTKGDSWVVDPARKRRRGITDFASSPRVSSWLVPKFGLLTPGAILHDHFCDDGIRDGEISPRDADAVFRSVLRRDGVPPLQRNLAWCGVRWGAARNPARRHEWWRDFPRLLLLTLVAVPIMLPAAIGITVGLALYSLLEWLISPFFDETPASGTGLST